MELAVSCQLVPRSNSAGGQSNEMEDEVRRFLQNPQFISGSEVMWSGEQQGEVFSSRDVGGLRINGD